MVRELSKLIFKEMDSVFEQSDFKNCDALIDYILNARKVVLIGAGRMGYAARGFSMRLKQLGINGYMIGDSNLTRINNKDLLIACSGSGETKSILLLVEIAKKNGSKIALITGNPDSSMGKLADGIIKLNAPSKNKPHPLKSIQPMTTLNEQCLGIFFDCLTLKIMKKINKNNDTMWRKHSNLE